MLMKQTPPGVGRYMKDFPALSWQSLLLVVFALTSLVRADIPQASSSAPSKIPLEYQETSQALISVRMHVAQQTAVFKKEPAKTTDKVMRGLLKFRMSDTNAMPFIWERDAHKLILDLNRNQDLTDDPSNAFEASSHSDFYAEFTNVRLPFQTSQGACRILADLRFYTYSGQPTCTLAVRSYWHGKARLGGGDTQVGVVWSDLSGAMLFEKGQMVLRPWEKRNESLTVSLGSMDGFSFAKKLFFNGSAYQVDVTAESKNGELVPSLQFTEQTVPLGDLIISGKHIRRLVLNGGPSLVILDQPTERVKVPIGNYSSQPRVLLEQDGKKASIDVNVAPSGKRLSVESAAPATLTAGGPLTNSISVSRHGQVLRMDYRLIGAGGAAYQLASQDRSKPPKYAVYKGDRAINTGAFEFG